MKLFLETTQAMSIEISGDGNSDQLRVITNINGKRDEKFTEARTDSLDFYNISGVVVGKLRFFSEKDE